MSDTSDQAAEAAPAADFTRPTPVASPHIEIRLTSGALVRVAPGVDHELLKVVMQTLAGSTC